MRKKYIVIALTAAIVAACIAAIVLSSADKKQTLVILHTNDTHSCITPLNPMLADTMLAGRGGYIRRAALIERERAANPSLLLFDSGDFSQGSPYYTLFKGDVEVELMNAMGYDAATIGNHEFDFGLENMARLFRKATFPVVCANYDFTGTAVEGLVSDYVVVERDDLRVGVFGLGARLEGLVDARLCEGVGYLDPVAVADSVCRVLRHEEHCDVVVCLSHLGWSDDTSAGDELLTASTSGIDIVLGGHSHTYFTDLRYVDNRDGRATPVNQNGKHGVFVGKATLNVQQ